MDEELASARTASNALRALSWLVLLVGGILGAAALYWGFTAVEPWEFNGYIVDEDWKSIGIGMLTAATIATLAGVVWGVIQAVRAVVWYIDRESAEDEDEED